MTSTVKYLMNKKRILILNLLSETFYRASFDKRIKEVFQDIDIPYDTIHLDKLKKIDQLDTYSHLMISGSTQSAAEKDDWYPDLDAVIHHFKTNGKSILGICFGHQYLVRHILGKAHVRKSFTPEIGWTEITLASNPLFKNIKSLKSAVFHYDEVFDLDEQFEITASSSRCAVQGFQVKGKPIWGIQFHPDFMYQDVPFFIKKARKEKDHSDEYYCQTQPSHDEFRVNDQVFKNWLMITA